MKQAAGCTLVLLSLFLAVGGGAVADDRTERFRAKLLFRIHSDEPVFASNAMFNMAESYTWGNGSADYVRAYMWYTLAVARRSPEGWFNSQGHQKITPRMTPQQIEKARQMAHQWMQAYWEQTPDSILKADLKEVRRRHVTGDDLALGEIVRRAQFGDQAAWIALGAIYWEGSAVEPDPAKALSWWNRVAEDGNAEIMNKLGILYLDGHSDHGIPADPRKGEIWLLRAATTGHTPAAQLLRILYRDGKGPVRADPDKYRYWNQKWTTAVAREEHKGRGGQGAGHGKTGD